MGRPETYFAAHRDLLPDHGLDLFSPDWPILTNSIRHGPAFVHDGAEVINSVLSAGCHVHGAVRNSVLGPGVVVEPGATVHDSILFADVTVAAGAQIGFSIVGEECAFAAGVVVGHRGTPKTLGADELSLLGPGCTVDADLPAGSRLEPGTTA